MNKEKTIIGFIGGCINNQKGLFKNDHYFVKVMSQLSTNAPDQSFSVVLSSYSSLNQLANDCEHFIERKNPDFLGVFIRPFTLMPLCKPFIKYKNDGGPTRWGVHPALRNRRLEWNSLLTDYVSESEYSYSRKSRIGLRDFNLMAGYGLGLHSWARQFLHKQISHIKQICATNNVELILFTPPGNPESLMGNWICENISKSLIDYAQERSIRLINLFKIPKSGFNKDLVHLNEKGHSFLAGLIFKELNKDIKKIELAVT